MEKDRSSHKAGLIYILQAYVLWGVLPLYWKLLKHVPAQEILTHRIFWSLIFILLLLWARKNLKLKAIFIPKYSFKKPPNKPFVPKINNNT